MNITKLDQITRQLTAFRSFQDLLDAEGNYRPSIYLQTWESWTLAEAYDRAQEGRGDPRRAYRGGKWPLSRPPKTWYWLHALTWTDGTVPEVAAFTGKDQKTVREALQSLQDKGLASRKKDRKTFRDIPYYWEMTFRGTLRLSMWDS